MYALAARAGIVIVGIVLLFSSTASAQQPSAADFYAAYARAREEIQPFLFVPQEQARLAETLPKVEGELEAMVRRIVGPVSTPKGFTGTGRWNGDWGLVGREKGVSGIGFSRGEPVSRYPYLLVSTMELLREWPSLPPGLRSDPEAVFRDGLMSSMEVMFKGFWSVTVGFLPIKTPAGIDAAFASASTNGNGFLGVWPARSISIYVRKGDRIYIADLPPAVEFPETVSCGVDLRAATDILDPSLLRPLAKRCWEGGGKAQPASVAAARQAQKFIDDLAHP
jgi:hypothetical protein